LKIDQEIQELKLAMQKRHSINLIGETLFTESDLDNVTMIIVVGHAFMVGMYGNAYDDQKVFHPIFTLFSPHYHPTLTLF